MAQLTQKQVGELYTYFALLENLHDFIDLSWSSHPVNRQIVKHKTADLKMLIGTQVNKVFREQGEDIGEALDQYQEASTMMLYYFKQSYRIQQLLDDKQQQRLQSEMDRLFRKYGINEKTENQ